MKKAIVAVFGAAVLPVSAFGAETAQLKIIGDPATGSYSVEATTSVTGDIRIKFYDNGVLMKTENDAPYCMTPEVNSKCSASTLGKGAHKIVAKVFAQSGRKVLAQTSRTLVEGTVVTPTPPSQTPANPGTPNAGSTGVGRTSYLTLPFWRQLFQQPGSSPGLLPTQLFWEKTSFFNDANQLYQVSQASKSMGDRGIIPYGGAQLWEDSFVKSRSRSTFGSAAPKWADGEFTSRPEHVEWARWVKDRPQLHDVAKDGGSVPSEWRSWGGTWGHISPLTPLDAADAPAGIVNATFGDWWAAKWGETAGKTGAYGIELSDFSDSQPHLSTNLHGFNPRIIARFEASIGSTIPGSTVATKANYINKNLFNRWNDFVADGYGSFFGAIVREISKNTGKDALVIDQNDFWPSMMRLRGIDARLILQKVPSKNIVFEWNTHSIEGGRENQPAIYGLGEAVIAAAREPNARFGANLSSDDEDFWAGADQLWASMNTNDRRERGLKELKRLWFESGWAHLADRTGVGRRALSFTMRGYHDNGTMDAALTNLISTVVPVRPFGPALYYPVSVERQVEAWLGSVGAWEDNSYLKPTSIVTLKDSGAPVGYYVSDAALNSLQPDYKPSAWIVLNRKHPSTGADMLPAAELQKLQSIAPVVGSAAELAALTNQPLKFSSGMTGFGFYDQFNRLVIVATNLGSGVLNGKIALRSLADGSYTATDLLTQATIAFQVSAGVGNLPVSIARWDSRALAIQKQ